MSKRRNISLLNSVYRTEALDRFFNVTVDQVFQPGKADAISGFIGRKPSYFDASKDFYKTEPTTARANRQLEAAMVSTDADGAPERVLFFEDFVNQMRAAGAPVGQIDKMIASGTYGWAPPIDLDKLLNFQYYYWVDDAHDAVRAASPVVTRKGNGSNMVFTMPAAVPAYAGQPDLVAVWINNIRTNAFTVVGSQVVMNTPPANNASVRIMRYADLVNTLSGMTHAPLPNDTSVMLTSGMRLNIVDAVCDSSTIFFAEGIGQSIELVEDIEDYAGDRPYVVIDRRSRDRNIWSRRNRWIHRSAIAANSAIQPEFQATRPIIEFCNNILLHNYGTYRVADIDCVMSAEATRAATEDLPASKITVADINGLPIGSVSVDDGHTLVPGDRLLARQMVNDWTPKTHYAQNSLIIYDGQTYRARVDHISGSTFTIAKWKNDPVSFVNNQVYTIEEVVDGNVAVYGLLLESGVASGAVVRSRVTDSEYWYDGEIWRVAQAYSSAPLFAVFDGDGVSFDDTSKYPGSDFSGSRIFGYAVGTGSEDTYIGQPLKHNEYGQIIFENDFQTRVYTDHAGTIDDARFYAIVGADGTNQLENAWHFNNAGIGQIVEDGVPVPFNLQANPDNEEPAFISRNQWFNHFMSILSGQDDFDGAAYAINNWRDTARDLGIGSNIVQHEASLLRPMLLASDPNFSLLTAIRYVEREYTSFKRKYLQRFTDLFASGSINAHSDATLWPQMVLASLSATKTSEFAFAQSSLAGGQYFIPATPAAMGIFAATKPEMFIDDSIGDGSFIRGHDGSITPAFGDTRDAMLLSLENMIYESLPAGFKGDAVPAFSLDAIVDGFFATDDGFSADDLGAIMGPLFERWCQTGSRDYRANPLYSTSDPFTWNYSSIEDGNGRPFAGNWRGIYRHVLGTDRPHVAPWEMLGFASQPSWWVSHYGPAPYTSGNLQMWEDIEAGRIAAGARAGISSRHARPGLLLRKDSTGKVTTTGFLPVDDTGDLLDPIAAKIVPTRPGFRDASAEWKFGDFSPVEREWTNSSAYGFAAAMACYLLKPALFTERCWDTQNTKIGPNGQSLLIATGRRPRIGETVVHGERINGVLIERSGLQQWISDYMVSRAQNPSILGDALRRTGVRLAHKVAGFTTSENMRVSSENGGLIPQEDIRIVLHQSPSVREDFYSGVLIEWTGNGYRVIGYDPTNPSFTIKAIEEFGPKIKLNRAADERPLNPWRANTYYANGVTIFYGDAAYVCTKGHTSAAEFEAGYWAINTLVRPSDLTGLFRYSRYADHEEIIPYGTVLDTQQDVINFLMGHGAYQESRGWKFSAVDPETLLPIDWSTAVDTFVQWAQIAWEPGNFLTMSPAANKVSYETEFGMILNVEQEVNGSYGIINRTGFPIPRKESVVDRKDGLIEITAEDHDIYGARVCVAEVEHALIFSNKTIFDNIIYEPLYNLRQPRLKISAQRAASWAGRFEAQGYIIINGEIRPSFDKAADDIRYMFDIENASNPVLRDHARHVIGYQSRDYLSDLGMSETQQFEFYQGMIQNKGSVGAFDKLLRSDVIGRNRDLRFLEEWAIRLGNYGARDARERWEFTLDKSEIRNQPQYVGIRPSAANKTRQDWVQFASDDGRWVDYPTSKTPDTLAFETSYAISSEALPTAGYVRRNETTIAAFDYEALGATIAAGTILSPSNTVWLYNTGAGDWDVFKVTSLFVSDDDNGIVLIETPETNLDVVGARITMANKTLLAAGDVGRYVYVAGETLSNPSITGVHAITAVDPDGMWFEIDADLVDGFEYLEDALGPKVFILRSVRFATTIERSDESASLFWSNGDLSYMDNLQSGKWAVQRFVDNAWVTVRQQGVRVATDRVASALLYNLNTKIASGDIRPQPLVLDKINIIDPAVGMIAGAADREIDFKLEYDPAVYGTEHSNQHWGLSEVGRLWWDLSAVRFLEAYTDDLAGSPTSARVLAELDYRINNWGRIAPGSRVNIYEWVRSEYTPADWMDIAEDDTTGAYSGFVYGGVDAPYVTVAEFDSARNTTRPVYYFWVGNRTIVPIMEDRNLSAKACADLIGSVTASDIPWLSPISATGLIVGGLDAYLENDNTVLQMELKTISYDGPVHTEWALVRPEDETSLPPLQIWNKLRDSLVGFDDNLQALPDPALHQATAVGALLRPRQNMFDRRDGDIRRGIMDGRRSFIEMLNYILARKNLSENQQLAINSLMQETTAVNALSWVQPDKRRWVETLPPSSEYDHVVYSSDDRDAFLTSKVYGKFIQPAPWDKAGWELRPWDADFNVGPRVLLNSLSESRPQWSVWQVDLSSMPDNETFANLESNLNQYLVPAKKYDYIVDSIAARDALPDLVNDDRVMVYDASTNDFWTVWRYQEAATEGYDAGFTLVNAQTYRTSDFVEAVDWYAEGYLSTKAPVVRYATIADRNAGEGTVPASTFVRVDDDGNGAWVWTAFTPNDVNDSSAGGYWSVVARENGTIQLSTNFYDYNRSVYGWADGDYAFDMSKVATRDGSFELRILFDLLWDTGLITDLEVNELFFSMLHFIHSQQDQVDWAFKTSFLSVVGYNEPLRALPLATPDTTETLISYLDEVKPYRVKTREFIRGLTTDIDEVHGVAVDFDKPRYFDPKLGGYRPLDINDPADREILATGPWAEWFADPTSDNVRNLDIELYFDRIWPTVIEEEETPEAPVDEEVIIPMSVSSDAPSSGAAQYIEDYYAPQGSMKEKNLEVLMNLGFKGTVIDGRRVVDGVAVEQDVRIVGTRRENADVAINAIGDRKYGFNFHDPYLAAGRPEELAIFRSRDDLIVQIEEIWTEGAPKQLVLALDVSTVTAATTTIDFDFLPSSRDSVAVFRDGLRARMDVDYVIDQVAHTVTIQLVKADASRASSVSLHMFGHAATGAIIAQRSFVADGTSATFAMPGIGGAKILVERDGVIADNSVSAQTSSSVSLNATPSAGTNLILTAIDSDGERVGPHYAELAYNAGKTWVIADTSPIAVARTIVERNGIRLMPPRIYYGKLTSTQRSIACEDIPASPTSTQVWVDGVLSPSALTIVDGVATANNPSLVSDDVMIIVRSSADEYDVVNGTLSIATMVDTDIVTCTTFQHSDVMEFKTELFNGNADSTYFVDMPFDQNSVWVTLNGRKAIPSIDYWVEYAIDAYDRYGYDMIRYDALEPKLKFVFYATHSESDRIVFTGAHGVKATEPRLLQMATRAANSERIIDNVLNPAAWEFSILDHERRGGVLSQRLDETATQITITVNPSALPEEMIDVDPFTIPDPQVNTPGIIWINNERIEYYGFARSGNTVTLTSLRRGTKRTVTKPYHSAGSAVYNAILHQHDFSKVI